MHFLSAFVQLFAIFLAVLEFVCKHNPHLRNSTCEDASGSGDYSYQNIGIHAEIPLRFVVMDYNASQGGYDATQICQ